MKLVLGVEELSKSFSGVRALEDVDVEVHEGEILGLVGPNGSGKTTLFNCVTGFVRATGGRIHWNGQDIARLAPDQIARMGIVRTFQQKMVFPNVTVRENLEMTWTGRRGTKNGARQLFLGCDDLLQFLGLAVVQDRLAEDVPFGFARKLGLGLALAANPQLLLLDEPAAGLTHDEGEELGELIGQIRERGVTVCIIEHHMELVMSISDRMVVLDAGRKIAEGRPAEIASDRAVIACYLGDKFAQSRRG